jgi:hypothetical protein
MILVLGERDARNNISLVGNEVVLNNHMEYNVNKRVKERKTQKEREGT